MVIGFNGVTKWLCNVCGHIWPQRVAYLNGEPHRCPLCRTPGWNRPLPNDAEPELCGA